MASATRAERRRSNEDKERALKMENIATHGIAGGTADDLQKDTAYQAAQQRRQATGNRLRLSSSRRAAVKTSLLGLRR